MKTQLKNRILSLTLSAAMLLSMFPSFTLPVGAAEAPPAASTDGTGTSPDGTGAPTDGTGVPTDGTGAPTGDAAAPAALTAEATLLSQNPSDGNIDDATELTNAFAAGGSYKVTTAFEVSTSTVTLSTGKEVTLDLNGKAITAAEGITPITVAGGTLRITDGTMLPGSITGGIGANGGGGTGGNGITVTSGELRLEGGVAAYSITGGAGGTGAGGNGIDAAGGTVTITGAPVITGGAGGTGTGGNGIDAAGGTVTITGAPVITGGAGGDGGAGGIGVKIATGAQLDFLDNSNPVVTGGAGGDSTSGVGGDAGDGISSVANFRIWNGTFAGGLGGSGATNSAGGVGGDAVYGNGITTIRSGSFTGGNGGAGSGSGNGGLAGTGVAVESVIIGGNQSNAIAEIRKNGTDSGTFIGGAGGTSDSGTGGKGGFGVGGWAGASVQILEDVTKASFTGGNGGGSSSGTAGTDRAKVGSTEANYVSYINDLQPAVVTNDTDLTTYAVSYYMNKGVADTYQIWYVGEGCEPLDLGVASGTTAPPDGGGRTFDDWVTAAASQGTHTAYDFGSTISAATSIYALWREETAFAGAPPLTKATKYLQQILTVNNLVTKANVTQGTVSGSSPTPTALGGFGPVAYGTRDDGTYAAQFDMSDTTKRNAAYNHLKADRSISYTAGYASGSLTANPIVKNATSPITMNLAATKAMFLDEATVNTDGCIAIGMAAPDNATTYASFQTALTKNPTHMITGQTYNMTIALRNLANDATNVGAADVKWYKQTKDGVEKAAEFTAAVNTVTQGHAVTFVSAPIIVDTGCKYFAVISDIDYFNSDPACVITPHADIGTGTDVWGLRTGDTKAIPVTAGDEKIKTGVLNASADINGAAATEFTVDTAYTLRVDPATVTDYREEVVDVNHYVTTYQKSENGAEWEDLAGENITPANTTCLYRAKLVPTKGSGLIGTFYTNILRTTTAKTATLALTTSKDAGFDHESVQLTATTNTANVGEVQFYQSADGGTAWTYLATVPVKTGKADYTVSGLKPQKTAYTFKAFYLANTEFNAVEGNEDKSFAVSSSAIKPNTSDGRNITASPALAASVESTLTAAQPMNASATPLTHGTDYTVAWYASANGTAWAEIQGEANGYVKVTPQSDKTMYFARISPAGKYKSGGFETNPIGNVTRVNTVTTLIASPEETAAYESGTLTLTATVKDAAANNPQTIIGGTVTFYVGTTQVGTASLVGEKAIIAIPMPKAGTYGDIRADYSGTEKYVGSSGTLASYAIKSATLPTDTWTIDGTPEVGKSSVLTLTASDAATAVTLGTDYTIRWEVYNGTSWSTLANSVGTGDTCAVTSANINYKYRAVVFPLGAYTQPAQGLIVNAAGLATGTLKATTTALAVDKAKPFADETITLTAKVTETAGNALVSGGFVTFSDGTNDVGTAPVGADGIAALTIAAPAVKTNYTATYTGDGVVYASSAASAAVTVTPQSVTIAVTGGASATVIASPALTGGKLVAGTKYALTVPEVTQSGNIDSLDYGDHYLVDWQENYKGGGWKYLSTAQTIDVIPADDFYQYRAVVRPAGPFSQPAAGITLGSVDGKNAKTASTVALTVAPTTCYEGEQVTMTATVDPAVAIGVVNFYVDNVSVGTAPVTGGTAILPTTIKSAGSKAIKAVYTGDSLYAEGEDTVTAYEVKSATIVLNSTTGLSTIGITLKGDNKPVKPGELVAGKTYTLTAPSVYASDDVVFTAALQNGKNYTIEWQYTNQDATWNTINGTGATIDVQPQSNQYQYRCVIMPVKGANSPFIKPETGITVTATDAAQLIDTVTTLAADPNTQFEGKTVKLTATVMHNTDKLVPTGTVTFYRDNAAPATDAALTTVTLSNGKAECETAIEKWSTVKNDNFYAVYNGNTTYATSQSGATAVAVKSASLAVPTFTVNGTRDALATNTEHKLILDEVKALDGAPLTTGQYSIQWQKSTDKATWTDIGATEATYVTPKDTPNGTSFRAKVTATADGYSTAPVYSTANATVGTKVTSAVVLATSATEAYEKTGIKLTATVTNTGTTPTGSVTFYEGNDALGNAIAVVWLDGNGAASCDATVPAWAAGAATATYFAQYSGDTVYKASNNTSAAITVKSTELAVPTFTPNGAQTLNAAHVLTLGGVTTLDTTALAEGTYSVQWQSSANSTQWGDIPGATLNTYTTPANAPNDTCFRVKVTATANEYSKIPKISADNAKVTSKIAPTVALATSAAEAYEKTGIKLTATVTNTGTTPTGSVTFYQGTSADAAKAIATVVLDANGKATCDTTVLGYTATDCANYFVQYIGDSIYTSAGVGSTAIKVWSTTVAEPTFTVAPLSTGDNRTTLKANTPYTFTLEPVKALDGRVLTTAGATYNVQWQSSPNGTAWSDIAGATDGTYVMPSSTPLNTEFRVKVTAATGAFVRDAKYSIEQTKVSNKAASQVTLTTSVASIYENATIKLTATVQKAAAAGNAIPQGSVTFYYGSSANKAIATVVLDARGQATCDAPVLPWTAGTAAPNTVTYYAVYSGNDVYEISVGTSSNVTVYSTTFAVPTFTVSDGTNNQDAIRDRLPTNVAYVLTAGGVKRLDGVDITASKTEYTLQWQISTDGTNWKNISGATSATYKMPITTEAGTEFRLQVAAQAQAFVKGTEVSTDRAKIAGGKADSDTTLTSDAAEQYEFKTVKLTAVVKQEQGKAMPTGTVTFYRGVKGANPVALETVTLVSGQAILKDVKVPAWTNAKGENIRDEAKYYAEYSGDAVYLPTDTDTANQITVAVKSTAIVAPTFKALHGGAEYTLDATSMFYNGMTAGIATELKLQAVKSKSGETLTAGKDYTISWQMKTNGTTIYVPISGATVADYVFTAGSDGDSYIVRIDPMLSATGNMLTGADSMATRVANIGTRLNATIVLDAKKLFDASGAKYNADVGAQIDGAHFGQSVVLTATVAAADRTNAFDLIADGGYVVFYDGTASDTHILGTANLEAKKVSGGVDKLIATATFETSALAIGEHTINAQFVSGKYYNPVATNSGTDYKVWSTTMDTDVTYRPAIAAATTAEPTVPVADPLIAGTAYALTLGDVYTESGEKMTLGQDYYILWQVSTDSGKAFREHASTEHGAGHTSSTTVTPLNNQYVYRAVVVPYDKSVKLDEPANGYTTNTFGTAVDATGIAVTSNLSEVYFGNAAEITAKLTPTTLGNPTGGYVYFYYSTASDIEASDYAALSPDGTGAGRLQYLSRQKVPDGIVGIDGKPIYSVSITTDKLPLTAENRYQPVYLYAFFTGTSSAAASQVTTGAQKVDVYSSTIYGDTTGTKTLATPSASTEGGIVISSAGDILVGDGAETTLNLKPIYTIDAKSKTLDNLVTADVPAGTILPQAVLANSTDYVVTWQVAQNYTGANSVWQDITDAKNTTAVVRPTSANFAYRAMVTAAPSDKTRASGTATAKYYSNVLTVGTANAVVQMAISPSSSYFAANTDGTETVNPSETAEENKTLVDVFVSGGSTTPTGSVTLSGTKQGSTDAAFAPLTYSLATGGSHLQFEVKDLPAGIYTLKVVYTGNSGYQTSEVQETYIVRYKPQIAMNAIDLAKIYDGKATEIAAKNFSVTAKKSGDLPLAILNLANLSTTFRFERLGADSKTWSWTDKAVDAGTYRVKAVLPESKYYLKSASDFVEFTISKRELSITDVVYQAKTYDAQTTAYPLSVQLAHDDLGNQSGHGIIVDDSVFVTGTAAYKTAAAGEASVTFTPTALNGADMDNYVLPAAHTEDNTYPIGRSGLTVNSKNVTDTALSALKVYDASGREMPRGTAAGGYNVRYYYHDGSGVKLTTDLSRKGKYTVVVAPTDTANFKGGESFVMNVDAAVTFDGNDAVAPAIPTLVLFTGTQFEFNDKDQSAAVKSTNAASAITGNTAKKTPGRYAAEATTAVETQNGILNIFKAEQPAKAAPSIEVGGKTVTELVFGTNYVVKPDAMPAGTYFTFVGDNIPGVAYEKPTDAGEYLVTLHVPATENYVAYTTSSKFLITKAPITIAAVAAKKQQYTTNPRWTATYTGSAAADFGEYRDMLVLPSYTLMASDANANADLTTPGNYSLTPAKAYSKNYEVTGYADSVFTIEVSSANLSEQLKLVGEPFGNIYYGDNFTLSAYGNYGLLSTNITAEPTNQPDGAATYAITNSQPTKEKVSNSSTLKYEVVDGSAVATIDVLTGKVETQKSGYFTVKLTRGTGVDAIYTYKTYHVGTQDVGVYMKAEDVVIYNGAVQGLTEDKYQTNLGGTLPVTKTVIYSGTGATPKAAGNYLVDITYSNGQYSGSGTGLLVIQQKAATVASDAVAGKTYGDAVAVTSYTETDKAVTGDTLLDPVGTTKVNMKANSDVGKYEIFTTGAVNPNYVLSYISADYGVVAKALTVEAGVDGATINTVTTQNMREYGKVNPTMGYRATGFIDGDGLADLKISDAANPAFVTYAKLQESDANREGGNAHAAYVNDNTAGYGITLYSTVANQHAPNYTLAQQDGVLDIYQAPVKLTVVSLTVPSGKKLVQKDFFAKADPLLTAAPMSDKLADLGIQYLVANTVVPDAGYTTAANDQEKAISATIKTGTKADAQNYWQNPAQDEGKLRVSENKRHTAITLGRTSSTAVVTEDVKYLPVYKYADITDPTIKTADEMKATGWYVRSDAAKWATKDYNAVSGEGTDATATYTFFNSDGTQKFAKDAKVPDGGNYFVLEGDASTLTKTVNSDIGNLHFYIFGASGSVVREGNMTMSPVGVYTATYASLPDGTYRIVLSALPTTEFKSRAATQTYYTLDPYTTETTLSGGDPVDPGPGPGPGGNPGSGGTPPTPILETKDHFAYIIGDENGKFNAIVDMTRAEAATVFYRLLRDKTYTASSSFRDVTTNDWFYDEVMALAAKDIIKGYSTGEFKPSASITRAEFCAMASRFFALSTGKVLEFDDVSTNHWAYQYILSAAEKGWVNGYKNSDGTFSFKPENQITRAEVVKIVNAMLGRTADKTYVQKHADKLAKFSDLTSTYWAYYDIMEAANGHLYTMDKEGHETWSELK